MCERERGRGTERQAPTDCYISESKERSGCVSPPSRDPVRLGYLEICSPTFRGFWSRLPDIAAAPSRGHHGIKKGAEGILFSPDAFGLGLDLKVEFTGKDLPSDLDENAAAEVDYQGGFSRFTAE